MAEQLHEPEFDRPGEACGVFGIYAPGEALASLTYLALHNLQHRGQQGAGISVSDGHSLRVYSDLGLVDAVFSHGAHLRGLPDRGIVATGHTRYGTVETSEKMKRQALQPMLLSVEDHEQEFTIAENGHTEELTEIADKYGIPLERMASDTEVKKEVIGYEYVASGDLVASLKKVLPAFKGAYSLVLSTKDSLIAVRDPNGFRPLHLGKLGEGGWAVASEIAAFNIIGAEPIREVIPGEILVINANGLESHEFAKAQPALCAFEFVYFSRPDNEMYGEVVQDVRVNMGRLLARRDNVEADFVIGVPNSGIDAADGYAWERGLKHKKSMVKNIYSHRTFIAPTQNERKQAVINKLSLIKSHMKDKSVIIVDDSIVRGTTQQELVAMCRQAGARKVHVRITSPPYKWPCFMGMDTGRQHELLAATMSVDNVRDYIGADSLMHLTNSELQIAVGGGAGKICTACTTGIYPIEVSLGITQKN